MKRDRYDRETRKLRQEQEAKDCGLHCAHLESYRTEVAALRAIERIKAHFIGSAQYPTYAYQCAWPCGQFHLSAQPTWLKGQMESGLSTEEWYEKQFPEMGWCDLG